ncbi:MAG: family N-acetyltransferase [Daejeonella sp.]|nr:family N-acetyltransferase [Daejeonella sp.]
MPSNNDIKVFKVNGDLENLSKVYEIRRIVFVEEQDCPPELEWEFEEESIHFLASLNEIPAGACRWRKTDLGYKLERFAVLKQFRGKGVAQALITSVLEDLPATADYIYLNAQLQAIPLYEKFGFVKIGEQFEEAGIQHFKMVMKH